MESNLGIDTTLKVVNGWLINKIIFSSIIGPENTKLCSVCWLRTYFAKFRDEF